MTKVIETHQNLAFSASVSFSSAHVLPLTSPLIIFPISRWSTAMYDPSAVVSEGLIS
ncbi:hypothetical protein P692DRAFT_20832145 [Suillus brevipes Sb2]|nr:hypothetical protein P692DRAFT_20832145 [Suillus brevipes Sb2]